MLSKNWSEKLKKMSNKSEIWVLADDRPGNYSQGIGLAEKLSSITPFKTQIKKISYNNFARLPNFLKICGLTGIDKISKDSLLNQNPAPKIIISAGRKTAPIAAFLKKHYSAFAIQIMNPNLDFKKFDVVILPGHDKETNQSNVIRINGALTKISSDILETEYKKFASQLDKISSPKITLLVGGSSKKGNFDERIAKDLGGMVSKITNKMSGNLLVLNSRRTGDEITEILDQSLNCQKIFFKWQSKDWQNPYFAALAAADFVIATGDSISMCSEICSIGKPVYIFNPPQICSEKHLKFHEDLFSGGFARKLDEKTEMLENYHPKKLDETMRVAGLIANLL
ncbi:MAG: hypothetical protein K0R25_1374 [Rickettsiaceae bacterium]|jgi:mitochondrial fission protein ELM1|nr:hypothetical protein [Rickettsiaceae bacterium]